MPADIALFEAMAGLQRGQWMRPPEKTLVVIDQFEQWLHAQGSGKDQSELLKSLRQCDGRRLQAIVLVRNDYWMPAHDFFIALDSRLIVGQNCQSVQLFDLAHARKVLMLFGQAYGVLPAEPSQITPEQHAFIDAAVSQLAEKEKVVSVRLSVFADLMSGRAWTPGTLARFGGAAGVGVAFLEEAFDAVDALPTRRRHRQAAQRVLKALLPPIGAEIKGHRRTDREMAAAAEYANRPPADFAELLKILDEDLRLITPAVDDTQASLGYQLTHDYLVPSLREWLARKQRETRRGRAELRLEERAATWTIKKENRQLPSLGECLRIAMLTKRRDWTKPQQRMMRRTGFVHALRATLATILVILLGTAAFTAREWQRIGGLTTSLLSANPDQILDIAEQLDRSPRFADAHLKPLLPSKDAANGSPSDVVATDPQKLLHARLALVARDASHESALLEVLLTGKYTYAIPIRERLRLLPAARFEAVKAELNKLLGDGQGDARRRFGAALALSAYVPASGQSVWKADDLAFVTRELVSANPEYQNCGGRCVRWKVGCARTWSAFLATRRRRTPSVWRPRTRWRTTRRRRPRNWPTY
jgi:hypothetical protein